MTDKKLHRVIFLRNKLFHFVRMMKKKSVQFFKGVVQVFGHILVGGRKKLREMKRKKEKHQLSSDPQY